MPEQDPGVRLKDELAADRANWQQRAKGEFEELASRVKALESFINSAEYYKVADGEKGMLVSQLAPMKSYLNILNQRVKFHQS